MNGIMLMAMLFGADPASQPSATQLRTNALVGRWRLVRVAGGGESEVCEKSKGPLWVFGDRIIRSQGSALSYELNKMLPCEIDLIYENQRMPGIYLIQGNRLMMSWDVAGEKRPVRFDGLDFSVVLEKE